MADLLEQEELQALGVTYQRSLEALADFVFEKKASSSSVSGIVPSVQDNCDIVHGDAGPDLARMKLACARELLRLGAVLPEQALELAKTAEVTADQARRSFDRLDTLERNKPTVGQAARYGAVGGLGGAAIGAVGHAIEGGSLLKGDTPKAKLLNLAANTAKGALGGGALPLARAHLDRRAETGTLRRFMQENTSA